MAQKIACHKPEEYLRFYTDADVNIEKNRLKPKLIFLGIIRKNKHSLSQLKV